MVSLSTAARSALRRTARNHPSLKRALVAAEMQLGLVQHTVASAIPKVIRPTPRKLTVAVTAHCNLRCIGCRYGRDFMPGQQLPLGMTKDLLDDAKAIGIETVRLYGGEPLLHPDLPEMVRYAVNLGLSTYITTNGLLLQQKIDGLYEAGLRNLSIGYYGAAEEYDRYTQRPGRFARLEAGVAAVRERYGASVSMQLNFLIMRPSCNLKALYDAWAFAERYDLTFHTDLIHYSLPYFTEGPDRELQFTDSDRKDIETLVAHLARLKEEHPERVTDSLLGIHSIPDWLLKGPDMRVPCDAHKLIWVGADGTVQLCYVTFRLGNLHERRLRDILFGKAHRNAVTDAFQLNCPNCHCERDHRVQKHLHSRLRYRAIRGGCSIEPRSLTEQSP